MPRLSFWLCLVSLPTLLGGGRAAGDSIRYTAVDVGLGPGARAYGINLSGEVVGSYSGGAFLNQGGVLTNIGGGVATAVNDQGSIAYDPGGGHQRGVNNLGQIIGGIGDTDAAGYLQTGDTRVNLSALAPSGFATPHGINDLGQVVGTVLSQGAGPGGSGGVPHPFLYSQGKLVDLGVPAGISRGDAAAINNLGQIVGNNGGSAFLLQASKMFDLGKIDGLPTRPNAINNLGQVVGGADGGGYAFLYHTGPIKFLHLSYRGRHRWI